MHLHKNGVIAFPESYSIPRFPDYLNDLNAMHEVEMHIAPDWDTYFEQLIKIRWRDAQPDRHPRDLSPASATAAQRAEAFLKTLNLWNQ
jgi:hypothetical protein